ncbi:hypothetical protein J3B02_003771 [Coemansia erecta]|nr:hypothetical protein J3B02_003771 [Coemansia erecta]
MYLPLLPYGDIGPVDAASIFSLARWTYGRALAMFFDSGRACTQMALLSAYSHNQFDAVFWHMCSLCYSENPVGRGRSAMLNAACAYARQEGGVVDDPIEALIIRLSQTVADGAGAESKDFSVYEELLSALNEDLDEIANNTSILNLDSDFWIREYQLSVILASLVTMSISRSGFFASMNADVQRHRLLNLQHLAVVLLIRQTMCLKQSLDIGEGHNASIIYALISLSLWMDIWRSNKELLSNAFALSDASCHADFARKLELLCGSLVQLVREHSDYDLSADLVGHYADAADSVLPHDVSLMGWVSLRKIQRQIKYQEIECMKTIYPLSASNPISIGKLECRKNAVSLPLWSDVQDVLHVSFARIQAMLLNEAGSGLLPFFSWSSDKELVVVSLEQAGNLQSRPVSVDKAQRVKYDDDDVPLTNGHSAKHVAESMEWTNLTGNENNFAVKNMAEADKLQESTTYNAAKALPESIRIPDFDFWCISLSEIQAWTEIHLYATLLTDANGYLIANDDDDDGYGYGNSNSNGDGDVPTAEDVPEDMRGIISSAIYMAYIKHPDRKIQICTDNEELEFYASWFGIDNVRSSRSKL